MINTSTRRSRSCRALSSRASRASRSCRTRSAARVKSTRRFCFVASTPGRWPVCCARTNGTGEDQNLRCGDSLAAAKVWICVAMTPSAACVPAVVVGRAATGHVNVAQRRRPSTTGRVPAAGGVSASRLGVPLLRALATVVATWVSPWISIWPRTVAKRRAASRSGWAAWSAAHTAGRDPRNREATRAGLGARLAVPWPAPGDSGGSPATVARSVCAGTDGRTVAADDGDRRGADAGDQIEPRPATGDRVPRARHAHQRPGRDRDKRRGLGDKRGRQGAEGGRFDRKPHPDRLASAIAAGRQSRIHAREQRLIDRLEGGGARDRRQRLPRYRVATTVDAALVMASQADEHDSNG
jgi:hypothetical protein